MSRVQTIMGTLMLGIVFAGLVSIYNTATTGSWQPVTAQIGLVRETGPADIKTRHRCYYRVEYVFSGTTYLAEDWPDRVWQHRCRYEKQPEVQLLVNPADPHEFRVKPEYSL